MYASTTSKRGLAEAKSGRHEEISLRERKAAATRIAVVQALMKRLTDTPLSEINADDLAADANVSRMTFFNYFPTKEHAVDHLMLQWLFRVQNEIASKNLRGVSALDLVFSMHGDEVAAAPERMRRLFAHFTSRPHTREMPKLTRGDRAVLAPGLSSSQELESLGGLLLRAIAEADSAGEIELVGSTYELAHCLGALLNGTALIGHSSPDTDWAALYRRHLWRALGLLGSGARRDPRPPKIPAAYRRAEPASVSRSEGGARKTRTGGAMKSNGIARGRKP